MRTKIADFGKSNIVTLIFAALCVFSISFSGQSTEFIFQEIITRLCRNVVLILALLMPVLCGMGLNFSIVLGAAAGQIGLICITHWGIGGAGGMTVCILIGTVLSIGLGFLAGCVFNRTVGQEMITGMIIGYFSKGVFDLIFLVLVGSALIPIVDPNLILSTGVGLKNTIDFNENVCYVFDHVLQLSLIDTVYFALIASAVILAALVMWKTLKMHRPVKKSFLECRRTVTVTVCLAAGYVALRIVPGFYEASIAAQVPVFTCVLIALVCLLNVFLSHTKLGQDIRSCGQDMQVAAAAGIKVGQTRIIATIISTVIASWGQIIYLQNMGLVNTYTSHEQVGMYAVAALLVGGASLRKATIGQVFLGALLFHILFFTMPLAGLNLFNDAQIGEYFRVFISYGIIAISLALYVWKELAEKKRALQRVQRNTVPTGSG